MNDFIVRKNKGSKYYRNVKISKRLFSTKDEALGGCRGIPICHKEIKLLEIKNLCE